MDLDAARAKSPTLSVVVPTYRESANVPVLFERIKAALEGLPWEMIVVDDDSPDGTSEIAFALPRRTRRMRCLRRVNRTGLAGAVIEGWIVVERRSRRGHRRRPPARRADSAENVRNAGRRRAISRSARA